MYVSITPVILLPARQGENLVHAWMNIEHEAEVMKVSNTVTTRASRKESLSTGAQVGHHRPCCRAQSCHRMGEAEVIGMEQDRLKRWVKEAVEIQEERHHEQR